MRALDLCVLLAHADDYSVEFMGWHGVVLDSATSRLQADGLLYLVKDGDLPNTGSIYKLTDKALVLINTLCAMPLPVQAWQMPADAYRNIFSGRIDPDKEKAVHELAKAAGFVT
jgi:hypothetical protein